MTNPTQNDILQSRLALNPRRPESNRTDGRPFFFGNHHFRKAKSAQKQVVSKKSRQSGTFREFGRLSTVFRNCPLFGQ